MYLRQSVSRRCFMGGAATALGYFGLKPSGELWAESLRESTDPVVQDALAEYDAFAKISFNENPDGPSDRAMDAMNMAFKYSMRYGHPDGNIQGKIAAHHGVSPENVMLGAGSGEILETIGLTYLGDQKKVVGVEPSYAAVYQHASGIKADAILLPLNEDYSQNIPAMIRATNQNYRDIGFVYMCNPNNPTGRTVSAREIRQLLDGIPEDMPVLIDEAYHHFVDDPEYATSVPYVLEGRKVIIARTFSKIYGMAGLRLGYAIASPEMIREMDPYQVSSINALVMWGGAASLDDTQEEKRRRDATIALRRKTAAELQAYGYDVIPSDTNFFMVHTGRPVQEVGPAFREHGVLVGRPFPPMLEHLRVSIGTEEEMGRFMTAFKQIFPATTATGAGRG